MKTTETLETLRRQRDEARASVAALREALEGCFDLMQTLDVDRELICYEKADIALSQPNPGAALLERLRCAEGMFNLFEEYHATGRSGAYAAMTHCLADWRKLMETHDATD